MPTSKRPIDHTEHRPGKDPSKMIDRLYSEGRTYPREQPARWPDRDAANFDAKHQGEPVQAHHPHPYHRHEEIQSAQNREDQHDKHYDSDTSGWVRAAPNGKQPTGNNETAERLPNYDQGQSYRRADKGNDWHSEFDQRHPGPHGKPTKAERNK